MQFKIENKYLVKCCGLVHEPVLYETHRSRRSLCDRMSHDKAFISHAKTKQNQSIPRRVNANTYRSNETTIYYERQTSSHPPGSSMHLLFFPFVLFRAAVCCRLLVTYYVWECYAYLLCVSKWTLSESFSLQFWRTFFTNFFFNFKRD